MSNKDEELEFDNAVKKIRNSDDGSGPVKALKKEKDNDNPTLSN